MDLQAGAASSGKREWNSNSVLGNTIAAVLSPAPVHPSHERGDVHECKCACSPLYTF
jgi:hypothetical protein